MKLSVMIPFFLASIAIIGMNFLFEGGFQIGRVLISFALYLAFKAVFNLTVPKEGKSNE